METGQRIQQARERAVFNRSELARAAGITYQALLNLETGKAQPRTSTIRAIAHALNIDPYSLVDVHPPTE